MRRFMAKCLRPFNNHLYVGHRFTVNTKLKTDLLRVTLYVVALKLCSSQLILVPPVAHSPVETRCKYGQRCPWWYEKESSVGGNEQLDTKWWVRKAHLARDVKEALSACTLLWVSESFAGVHQHSFVFIQCFTGLNWAQKRSRNYPGAAAVQSLNVMDVGEVTVSCVLHMGSSLEFRCFCWVSRLYSCYI